MAKRLSLFATLFFALGALAFAGPVNPPTEGDEPTAATAEQAAPAALEHAPELAPAAVAAEAEEALTAPAATTTEEAPKRKRRGLFSRIDDRVEQGNGTMKESVQNSFSNTELLIGLLVLLLVIIAFAIDSTLGLILLLVLVLYALLSTIT